MFPLECLVQLLWCSCLLMNVSVCVCMCVRGCVCAHMRVNSSWKSVLVIKLLSTLGRKLSTILVTVLCLLAVPAFEYSPLKAHIWLLFFLFFFVLCKNWPIEHLVNVGYSCWSSIKQLEKLHFGQAVSYCLELICLKYYLPFILILYFTYSPIRGQIWNYNLQKMR